MHLIDRLHISHLRKNRDIHQHPGPVLVLVLILILILIPIPILILILIPILIRVRVRVLAPSPGLFLILFRGLFNLLVTPPVIPRKSWNAIVRIGVPTCSQFRTEIAKINSFYAPLTAASIRRNAGLCPFKLAIVFVTKAFTCLR